MVQRIIRQDEGKDRGIGLFLYDFLELLIMKDPHHLMELEDRLDEMEEQNVIDHPENFNRQMTAIRKEIIGWIRYYTQLSDVVCEFLENENSFFSEEEIRMLRLVDKRIERLQNEAVALREYAVQVRELFQSEISIRQNQIMKVLTIVTTIFMPLSLIAGWYGMNFVNMPELRWEYGYPSVIAGSVIVVLVCLWFTKTRKFW